MKKYTIFVMQEMIDSYTVEANSKEEAREKYHAGEYLSWNEGESECLSSHIDDIEEE